MGWDHKEWSANTQIGAHIDDSRVLRVDWVEQYLLLLFHDHRGTVVVAFKVQLDAMVHQVSAA